MRRWLALKVAITPNNTVETDRLHILFAAMPYHTWHIEAYLAQKGVCLA